MSITHQPPIRVKAIAVIRRGDALLLSFAVDPDSGTRYGRFLGGGIEPGERADEALRRELREELGVEIAALRRVGVIENLYASATRQIHEVIFVFTAAFVDPGLYRCEHFAVNEAACDGVAEWVPVEQLRRGGIPVYPPELLDLIDTGSNSQAPHPV